MNPSIGQERLRAFRPFSVSLSKVAFRTCAFFVLLGYLGSLNSYAELATHFQMQYLLLLLACGLVLAIARQWRWLAGVCVFVLITGIEVVPWHFPSGSRPSGGRRIRVVQANLLGSNQQHARFLEWIADEQPDLIVLEEVTHDWLAALGELDASYPYRIAEARHDNFGIAVFSKLPLENANIVSFGDSPVPSIVADLPLGTGVKLVCAHPLTPTSPSTSKSQKAQLSAMAEFLGDRPRGSLVIGDLNTTVWSPHYRPFVTRARLQNARQGFGIMPTFPTLMPPVSIPIDHILHNAEIRVLDLRRGPPLGSDHWPLVCDLDFPE